MLSPRESGEFIASKSVDVSVVEEAMSQAAHEIFTAMKKREYSTQVWKDEEVHPKLMNEETVDWIFVVDSLNFSFWLPTTASGGAQFELEHEGKKYEDYQALCMALNRAIKEGIPLSTPSYYKDVTLETMQHVFRSSNGTTLPLLQQRTNNINTNGKVLCDKYKGSFVNVISECKGDVKMFINKVTELFPSYRDTGVYHDQHVSFYKRVQILCADIWACFEGSTYGQFDNIEELTMFADYRVPQSLQALGILKYSEGLLERLREGEELVSGSVEEMEIRGCSIHCVELLAVELNKLLRAEPTHTHKELTLNSVMIDFYLWGYATHDNPEGMRDFPEHRTRSTFY